MSTPVRIGFLGTGGIAGHHLKQLQAVPEAKVVALCDTVAERAQGRAEEFGGTAYTSFDAMLDQEELDALYVCIPPFAHTDAEIRAAKRGIHLFVEKPVAFSVPAGLEVAAAIRDAGVFNAAGYTLRYLGASVAAREYLRDKEVAMVTCNRWGGLPGTPWWRVMDQSGGQLVEMTTHQVDLMRWCLGEVVEVHARYARRALSDLPDLTIPDVQIATLQFASGAIGVVTTSCVLTTGGGRSEMDFLLRDARLHYTTNEVKVTPDSAAQAPALEPQPTIDEGFIRAIVTGDASHIRCSYLDGLRTADVTLAANQSAATGEPVAPVLSRQ
jgi:predicted dehydrogenase